MTEQKSKKEQNINNEAEVSDLPQEITESYGTGVSQQPGMNIGGRVTT